MIEIDEYYSMNSKYNRTNRKTKNVWSKGSKRVQLRKGKQIKHTHT